MRLSSNLTIKIKLFDILFYNTLYFRVLRKLIFWTHRISSLTAAELPPSPRREGWKYGSLGWRPNGEWKYGSLGWHPEWRGGNMGLEYGRRLERSNAKNSNKTGKTETARIETGGQNRVAAWGQGQNRERPKGNKRFQKRRKATKKRCRGCFLLKYR